MPPLARQRPVGTYNDDESSCDMPALGPRNASYDESSDSEDSYTNIPMKDFVFDSDEDSDDECNQLSHFSAPIAFVEIQGEDLLVKPRAPFGKRRKAK
jgi:hypothetical protein